MNRTTKSLNILIPTIYHIDWEKSIFPIEKLDVRNSPVVISGHLSCSKRWEAIFPYASDMEQIIIQFISAVLFIETHSRR